MDLKKKRIPAAQEGVDRIAVEEGGRLQCRVYQVRRSANGDMPRFRVYAQVLGVRHNALHGLQGSQVPNKEG